MEYWPIYEYCEEMVSVKKSSRGNRYQLSDDKIFKAIFENYNIKISDKGHLEFDDILLEFSIETDEFPDDSALISNLKFDDKYKPMNIIATEKHTKPKSRFTEASLVK